VNRLVGHALDQLLVLRAVADEVGDGAELEAVALRERDEIGHARHRAVGVHDLADDRRGREPRELGEIAARFRVTGADQHAALLRHHRKHVARLHDVLGLRMARGRGANRARPIRRRDAGGHPGRRLDRNRERGAQRRAIVVHHEREVQLPATLLGEREADEPARMGRHEVDRFRRHEVGGEQEVALVLAIFRVGEHDHAPEADVVDQFLRRVDGHIAPNGRPDDPNPPAKQ
jgi:hypothetical protein